MDRTVGYEEIFNAREAWLYDNRVLYIVDSGDGVFGYSRDSAHWFRENDLRDSLDSGEMRPHVTPLSREEAAQLYLGWTGDERSDNHRLGRAMIYAVEHHDGQFRKGTVRPYILHPIEVMQLLCSMRADLNLIAAGVLHDTVEDTSATEKEIRELFGDDIADLVASHSEDKSKTWQERKQHAIEELRKADKRLKMLVMADKVSNLRSMAADYQAVGESLWNRFNAGPDRQAWYYRSTLDALKELEDCPECASVYQEMAGLCDTLFARFSDSSGK